MKLDWGSYKHFPYERELALREIAALMGTDARLTSTGEIQSEGASLSAAKMLTYFASVQVDGCQAATIQRQLEQSASATQRRQSTRYSVHGLHEYRGKFNPQVCRALINILGVPENGVLLDPFCGSGTTLVEAAHRGARGVGTDLNPLAVFIANTKLQALVTPADELDAALQRVVDRESGIGLGENLTARGAYLEAWFEPEILPQIEKLRIAIEQESEHLAKFFLVVASDLLREFSLQDPADLRIRRRPTANVTKSFVEVFSASAREAIRKLASAQAVVGTALRPGRAYLQDNRALTDVEMPEKADAAITSPPYATALPYIDTQRLSLVWLSLIEPDEIAKVEANLTGSREMGTKAKRAGVEAICSNLARLPEAEANFCAELQAALTEKDGFRRQAVPVLLYRYFDQMAQTFRAVSRQLKPGAPFALIVGHNHTVLGGQRFDIDTPKHLASLAESEGWAVSEVTALQAYQRYGIHASNAVKAETLLVVRAPHHAGETPTGNQHAPRLAS
ncbi:TRM11 family SAM-dependent methyltransferase [Brevundimonas naejangsanensis]|uniref:TRM11 family SAM-dependent methyltransferase n=1 Tax=Brevundimonas naejangsanensis TaxID=588932 RepID=UPI00040F1221|nr:DNA methyltransferase [Brevundimonas naejangsanensis]